MLGEGIREPLYSKLISENEPLLENDRVPGSPNKKKGSKWRRYSGLFILLKQKWALSKAECLFIQMNTSLFACPLMSLVYEVAPMVI